MLGEVSVQELVAGRRRFAVLAAGPAARQSGSIQT
jgi:hypothetical protein